MAGAPLFSINRGKGNIKKAEAIMNTSFSMLCICGVTLMVIGMLFCKSDSGVVRGVGRRAVLRISIYDDLFDRNSPIYDCNRDEPIY